MIIIITINNINSLYYIYIDFSLIQIYDQFLNCLSDREFSHYIDMTAATKCNMPLLDYRTSRSSQLTAEVTCRKILCNFDCLLTNVDSANITIHRMHYTLNMNKYVINATKTTSLHNIGHRLNKTAKYTFN